ncbi:MAG: helix-turn-helix transcriptional regulator [Bacteroidota bacterium]
METLGLILLVIAYTVGIIMILVQAIAYKKKIEYLESILLSLALLALIITVTVIKLINFVTGAGSTVNVIAVALSAGFLGFTLSYNVFTEREVKINQSIKRLMLAVAVVIPLLGLLFYYSFHKIYEAIVSLIIYALMVIVMVFVRKTKVSVFPENSQRKLAIITAMAIPVLLTVDTLVLQASLFRFSALQTPLTLPVLFIFLSLVKIRADLKRLSFFKSTDRMKAPDLSKFGLTTREIEVAELIRSGATYKQIAEQLFVSMPTVKTHVSNIYKKTGVNNKVELINLINV